MSGSQRGVSSSVRIGEPAPATAASCDGEQIHVTLTDGRMVSHPVPDWVRRAPLAQRRNCEVQGFGTAIYWPDLDEEMGVNEIFGVPEDLIDELAGFTKGMPQV
ncbi:MAG: hypothetical protein A3G84_05095 [Chloroflexi bacterium RIFCSPLOWO2_12_FULL_71_12]|nr:MAG: hypothetical protein A3G84_05095 [Chloroflexi bacterium RIFCSPLOWO2_12_FULL_71_12]